MAFTVARTGRLFVIRWTDLDLADLERASFAIRAANAEVGALVYVTIVAASARIPNRAERAALDRFAEENRRFLDSVYLVLQGDGLRHTLQRTAMAGIRMLGLRKKLELMVVKSSTEIFSSVAERLGIARAEVEKFFVERSLV
jgi:hypothetical protein